jgi:hypothetical protein
MLGEKPSSDEVCKAINTNKRGLFERMTVAHTYNLGEVYRQHKCEALKELPAQVESIFKNELGKMTKPSNLHYAYMLSQHAKDFGVTPVDGILQARVKDHLLEAFNTTDYSIIG